MKVIKMLKELDENLALLAIAGTQLREATTEDSSRALPQLFYCCAEDVAESYRRLALFDDRLL